MKQTLPQQHSETLALFPRNIRFITEYTFTESQSHTIKVVLTSIVSLFLLALIFLQSVALLDTVKDRKALSQQKAQLQSQAKYWEDVSNKYQGYRDVYYRIAAIQYKLGNTADSQKYIKKALELDPNFPEGRVLGAKVGL